MLLLECMHTCTAVVLLTYRLECGGAMWDADGSDNTICHQEDHHDSVNPKKILFYLAHPFPLFTGPGLVNNVSGISRCCPAWLDWLHLPLIN